MAIPNALLEKRHLLDHEGDLVQKSFAWNPHSWRKRFKKLSSDTDVPLSVDYKAALARIERASEKPPESKRPRISRSIVTDLCSPEQLKGRDGSLDRQAVTTAFIAAMIWGYGLTGYGPYRTERVLVRDRSQGDSPAIEQLLEVAEWSQSSGGGGEHAFTQIATRRATDSSFLKYLGPAFGTKFIYFLTKATDNQTTPVLDSLVAGWIRRNAPEVKPLKIGWWDAASYGRYVGTLQGWAEELAGPSPSTPVDLDDIELLMFWDAGGSGPTGSKSLESENVTVESMLDDLGAEADARGGDSDRTGSRLLEELRVWFAMNPPAGTAD